MQKSIPRIIAEGTLWTSSSTLVVKVISLASVFLILRSLGVAEYGIIELSLSITALFSLSLLPGLDTLVVADMGIEKEKGEAGRARSLLRLFIMLQYALAATATAVIFFLAENIAAFYSVPVLFVQLVAASFLLSPLRSAYGLLFRVQLRFFLLSLLTLLEESSRFVFLLASFLFFGLEGSGVLLSILFSQGMALVLLAPVFIREWRALSGGSGGAYHIRELAISRGFWSVLSTYVGNVGKSARLWIIQRLLGAEAVGLFAVALGLIGHTLALAPLSSVLSPMLPQYVGRRDTFIKLITKGIKYQFLAYVVIGVIGFFLFPPLIEYLFPQFVSAIPLFRVMLFGLIPVAVISVVTPVYFALRLQRNFFISMAFKTTISIIFTYGLAVIFGIWGLAVEYILTSVVYGFERVWTLRKHIPELALTPSFTFDDTDRLLLQKSTATFTRVMPGFLKKRPVDSLQ